MNKEELKNNYSMLYKYMASSSNPEYMKAFGAVMNEMMDWMVANKPEAAEVWVEKLSAIKWDNYLTTSEAESIVASMQPDAPWSRDVWNNAMNSLGLEIEDAPHYNRCALWVTMNMVYSDSANTIAKIMGANSAEEVDSSEMVKAVYSLALDKLKDEDKRFNIRKYFGLV